MKPYIVFHHPCPDGWGAAYAAWRNFGDDARYVGMTYGDPLPELEKGAPIYFLDFSLKRDGLLKLAEDHEILIIDHHISMKKEVENLDHPNIEVIFDNDRSGAVLAWRYFHADEVPDLLLHVEDRDLFRHELTGTREVYAALNSYPFEFEIWHDFVTVPSLLPRLITEGKAILRAHNQQVEAITKEARQAVLTFEDKFFFFPAVNAPYCFASDVCNRLLDEFPDAPFAGAYRDGADGKRYWSLRSRDERMDAQKIASAFGGGGHRNAAGLEERWCFQKIGFTGYPYKQ